MVDGVTTDLVARGEVALASGDWRGARTAFADALEAGGSPEALDGLGRALWWLRDVDEAIASRECAYAAFRRSGETLRAARIAMWLAREYLEAVGNEPASRGWLARAEGLIRDHPETAERGWLALTRGRLALDPASARGDAETAVEVGRDTGDADLEVTGLALLGLALIVAGDVEEGMAKLDEGMAAATGGEVQDQDVFGDVCCIATRAAEEAGDVSRLMRWNEVVMGFMSRSGHAPLLEFCGTCCAEVLLANGQLGEAEGWLVRTLRELQGTGHRARCIHPAAKLAELRLLQGRVEDAERLLEGYEDRPDALRATAAVHLARGETAVAAALLHRRLNQVGDGLLARRSFRSSSRFRSDRATQEPRAHRRFGSPPSRSARAGAIPGGSGARSGTRRARLRRRGRGGDPGIRGRELRFARDAGRSGSRTDRAGQRSEGSRTRSRGA